MHEIIPTNFQFSQSNLQDYANCPRRFQLRWVDRVVWPAVPLEPMQVWEARQTAGSHFHRLVQRQHAGAPEAALERQVQALQVRHPDIPLETWWRNYREHFPAWLPETRYVETLLSTVVAGKRLVARYDLLAVQPGDKVFIVDWKTSDVPPQPKTMENRLQTVVYRYVITQAGQALNGGKPFLPEQVELVYWYPAIPQSPIRLPYTGAMYHKDETRLKQLVGEISRLSPADFPKTNHLRACQYCVYRSLCEREISPGTLAELDEEDFFVDEPFSPLDFDQVPEIEL